MQWLLSGAALFRAAKAVLRQAQVDTERGRYLVGLNQGRKVAQARRGLDVTQQAIFLAALATENALKAVLVESGMAATTASGELPATLLDHDLARLAKNAGVAPHDNHEEEALRTGASFIAGIGRYPGSTSAHGTPGETFIAPWRLVDAHGRLFFRMVEEVARVSHPRGRYCARSVTLAEHVAEMRTRFDVFTGGISSPVLAELLPDDDGRAVPRR